MSQLKRPVNLDLTKFRFPPMAIVSILHRISGVLLFISIPFFLYLLHQAYASPESFQQLVNCLTHPVMRIANWVFLSALAYHVLAGIRHLIMDCGVGESLCAGRATSYLVMFLGLLCCVFLGVWLW